MLKYAVQKGSAELSLATGGYLHTTAVPLATLSPGAYTLTIAARPKSGGAVERSMAFSVR